jgi:hypothetical protein
VGASVEEFRELLGLDRGHRQVGAHRWRDAASDVREQCGGTDPDAVDSGG